MKTVHTFKFLTIAAAAMFASAAYAQLGNGGTNYSSVAGVGDQSATFMQSFIGVARADAKANATLLDALGAPDAAASAIALTDALGPDATPGSVGDVVAATSAAHQLALQKLGAKAALNESALAKFNASATMLLQTARDYKALTANIVMTKKSLQAIGAPGRPALAAAKSAPDVAAQLRAELKAVVEFANANQIALAKEVSDGAASI